MIGGLGALLYDTYWRLYSIPYKPYTQTYFPLFKQIKRKHSIEYRSCKYDLGNNFPFGNTENFDHEVNYDSLEQILNQQWTKNLDTVWLDDGNYCPKDTLQISHKQLKSLLNHITDIRYSTGMSYGCMMK